MSDMAQILTALIAAAGAVIVAWIGTRSARSVQRDVREVHESTVNSHGPDMRTQLDRIEDVQALVLRTLEHHTKDPDAHKP